MGTTGTTSFHGEGSFPPEGAPAASLPGATRGALAYAESVPNRDPWERGLREALEWKPGKPEFSHNDLDARWQIAAERIGGAFADPQKRSAIQAALGERAKIISDHLSIVKQALLESRVAIQKSRELPHVETSASRSPLPRSFELATVFLRSTADRVDEEGFQCFVISAQEQIPLKMSEIWNLKPFLELALMEQIGDEISRVTFRARNGALTSSSMLEAIAERLQCLMSSLLLVFGLEWEAFFDQVCDTERILREDPQASYPRMDRESREAYRAAVEEFAAHSEYTESEVARKSVDLALQARENPVSSSRTRERRTHVGYYLMDGGREALKREIGYRASFFSRMRDDFLKWPDFFYLIGIEMCTLAVIGLLLMLLHVKPTGLLAMALFLLPAVECAVATMNLLATRMFSPRKLPKLDFSKGIPRDCAAVVAVPALLTSEKQVRLAVQGLEIRFLANQDPNLHFALLTDLPDSTRQFDEKENLVALCSELVRGLNERYGREGRGAFFHFHRHRVFNEAEGIWMGWERKRGKLLDFNRFLLNQGDRFPVKIGNLSLLRNIRYVITLDLDTELPSGAARRLVGTLAHPLNRAVIDPGSNMVFEGYGILQPRVDISIKSSSRSRFASLLSGDTGFDIYTRAVSDVYQDLFGEGIFTGKGIYEVETFQKVLEHRLPRNMVLSHDLIEGAYARAGLVSDVAVVDDYPSHFRAFSRRKHRWVRGDWQIIFSLLPWVPNDSGQMVRNPLSQISRWKIVDNLRRSLMDCATLLVFLCGWLVLPHNALAWTLAALALMLFPTYFHTALSVITGGKACASRDFWKSLGSELAVAHARMLVRLAFLLQQSLTDLDAVVRALVRMKFTHKRLLEWETAADAENAASSTQLVDFYMRSCFLICAAMGALLFALQSPALKVAWPFLMLWGSSIWISKWLNRPQPSLASRIKQQDRAAVRFASLRTWRFFREFSNREENWLIPDIVQEAPPLVAHRISPTNLGLLLNARLAAHDLGYLTIQEFIEQTEHTFDAVARMPKCQGHLFNWYTTDTLEPVEPFFVSTVDNGNLLCCLLTLKQGCLEMLRQPLLRPALWDGVRDHLDHLHEALGQNGAGAEMICSARDLSRRVDELASLDGMRLEKLNAFEIDVMILVNRISRDQVTKEVAWWAREVALRVTSVTRLLENLAPWLSSPMGEETYLPAEWMDRRRLEELSLESMPHFYRAIAEKLRESCPGADAGDPRASLRLLQTALQASTRLAEHLGERLATLAEACQSMADEMDFSILYDPKKKLFSIGYDHGEGALSKYSYDLLASEARAAVFGAIAKGEAPQESWFQLKRAYRSYKGENVILSWTGTAFEYLMPCLWIRAFPNTLLERSVRAAIRAQQKFAAENGIPWGISESACNERNPDGHYRYHAFGVSGLAVHRDDCSGDLVVAPYATFLGLLVDPAAAVQNLQRMKELGWLAAYGFYEAADFTPRRVSSDRTHTIVRSWMAHHQAMSLVAAANMLCDSSMQRRFHAEPRVAAAERLLHEKQPRTLPFEGDAEANSESSTALQSLAQQIQHPGFRDLVPKLL
jgi:cyclic beta-1,2-glucan synthetase